MAAHGMTVVWISSEPACPSIQMNRQPLIENVHVLLTVESVLLAFSDPIVSALIYLKFPFPDVAEILPEDEILPVADIDPDVVKAPA